MYTFKSTILKMINGIVSYDSGDILYKNSSIKNMDAMDKDKAKDFEDYANNMLKSL